MLKKSVYVIICTLSMIRKSNINFSLRIDVAFLQFGVLSMA